MRIRKNWKKGKEHCNAQDIPNKIYLHILQNQTNLDSKLNSHHQERPKEAVLFAQLLSATYNISDPIKAHQIWSAK